MCYDINVDIGERGAGIILEGRRMFRIVLSPAGFPNFCHNFCPALWAFLNRHHNFVVIAPMIMKFGTGFKLDEVYTMVTKKFVTSLLLSHCDVITCILVHT